MLINWRELSEPFGRALLIVLSVLLIWLLRRLLILVVARPIGRLLHNSGRTDIDGIITNVIAPPMRILLIAFALFITAQLLELDAEAFGFVSNITRMLVVIAFALIAYRVVTLAFLTRGRLYSITGIAVEEALLPFARTGLQIVILAITLVIIINDWGYDVSGLIAGLGIGGLAISLAAQDTLSNLFGFTAIVGDRPFSVGEYIKTKDVEGIIEQVGLRSTRVRQLDQAVVTVPNSVLASSAILNWSRLRKRQINLTLGITYGARSEQVETLLQRLRDLLVNWENADAQSVVVNLVNLGDRSLEILVRCYLNIADWGPFTQEKERIFLAIMRIVEEIGLQVAVPSRTIYIENLGEVLSRTLAQNVPDSADGHESERS
jgi:MscS family membrane protein